VSFYFPSADLRLLSYLVLSASMPASIVHRQSMLVSVFMYVLTGYGEDDVILLQLYLTIPNKPKTSTAEALPANLRRRKNVRHENVYVHVRKECETP